MQQLPHLATSSKRFVSLNIWLLHSLLFTNSHFHFLTCRLSTVLHHFLIHCPPAASSPAALNVDGGGGGGNTHWLKSWQTPSWSSHNHVTQKLICSVASFPTHLEEFKIPRGDVAPQNTWTLGAVPEPAQLLQCVSTAQAYCRPTTATLCQRHNRHCSEHCCDEWQQCRLLGCDAV